MRVANVGERGVIPRHDSREGSVPLTTYPHKTPRHPGSSDGSSDIEVLSKASSSSIEVLTREDPEGQEDDDEEVDSGQRSTGRVGVEIGGKAPGRSQVTSTGESPVGSCKSGVNMTSSTSSGKPRQVDILAIH
jgi:hypothetical protein